MPGTIKVPDTSAGAPSAVVDPSGAGDYTEINAACAAQPAGAIIAIRPGTYSESSDIQPKQGQCLIGYDGRSGDTLVQMGNNILDLTAGSIRIDGLYFEFTASVDKSFVDADSNADNFVISDCTFDWTPTGGAIEHKGFYIDGCSNGIFQNVICKFDSETYTEFRLYNLDHCHFEDIYCTGGKMIYDGGPWGVHFFDYRYSGNGNIFSNIHVHSLDSADAAYFFYVLINADTEGDVFENLYFEGTKGSPSQGGFQITATGGYFTYFAKLSNITVNGCAEGYYFYGIDGFSCDQLHLKACQNYGFRMSDCYVCSISNLVIDDGGSIPFWLPGGSAYGITGVNNPGGGEITVLTGTTPAANQRVLITGTTDYNGIYIVNSVVAGVSFNVTATYVSSQTGEWGVGSSFNNFQGIVVTDSSATSISIYAGNYYNTFNNVSSDAQVSCSGSYNLWKNVVCDNLSLVTGHDNVFDAAYTKSACYLSQDRLKLDNGHFPSIILGLSQVSSDMCVSNCRFGNLTVDDAYASVNTKIVNCEIDTLNAEQDGALYANCEIGSMSVTGARCMFSSCKVGTTTVSDIDNVFSGCSFTTSITVSANGTCIDGCDVQAITFSNPYTGHRIANTRFRTSIAIPTTADNYQFSNCRFDADVSGVSGASDQLYSGCFFHSTATFRGTNVKLTSCQFDGAVSFSEGRAFCSSCDFKSTVTGTAAHNDFFAESCLFNGAVSMSIIGQLKIDDGTSGSMGCTDNASTNPINTTNAWHAVRYLGGVSIANMSFAAGGTAAITGATNPGGGQTTFQTGTTPQLGDIVCITGTTNYNGVYTVNAVVAGVSFTVTVAFVSSQTGTWGVGSNLRIAPGAYGALGWYSIFVTISSTQSGTNQDFEYQLFRNTTPITYGKQQRRFSTAGDVGSIGVSGDSYGAPGDRFWIGFRSITGTSTLTNRNVNFQIEKQ